MTIKNLDDFTLSKLKISSADFSDRLVYYNIALRDICEKITEAHQNYFGVYSTKNLVASSDETKREYTLPDDILNNLVKIELKIDGTNWVPATRIELTQQTNNVFQESKIRGNFNNETPKYAVFRNSIIIFSGELKAVTNGLRLWYLNYPSDIPNLTEDTNKLEEATDKDATIKTGLPKQFHELLSRGVIINYKGMYELPLTGREPLYDEDLEIKIKRLRNQDLDQIITAKVPYNDGSQY